MTNYDCFSDWAWGHIQDVYGLNEDGGITLDLLQFVENCANEAQLSLSKEEQDEMFRFTLDQVKNGDLLDHFYAEYGIKV